MANLNSLICEMEIIIANYLIVLLCVVSILSGTRKHSVNAFHCYFIIITICYKANLPHYKEQIITQFGQNEVNCPSTSNNSSLNYLFKSYV